MSKLKTNTNGVKRYSSSVVKYGCSNLIGRNSNHREGGHSKGRQERASGNKRGEREEKQGRKDEVNGNNRGGTHVAGSR